MGLYVCRTNVIDVSLLPFASSPLLAIIRARWRGTRWRSWLRHCSISRTVAGSIPDGGLFKIFQLTQLTAHGPGVDSASNNEYQRPSLVR